MRKSRNYNRSIVTKAPAWLRIKNGELAVSPNSSVILNDYLIKFVRDPKISKDQLKKMKKDKTIAQAYQPVLFQKTDQKDKKGKIIYIPIPKAGNRSRMLEIYKDDQESILPGNNLQIETQAALTSAEGYVSAKDLMRQPAFIKALEEAKSEKVALSGLKAMSQNALKSLNTNKELDETISKKEEESVKCNKGK